MNMGAVAHLSRFQCVAYCPLMENHVSPKCELYVCKEEEACF